MIEKFPKDILQSKIRTLAQPYTVKRADGSAQSDGSYGSKPSYSELGERYLYLYKTSERGEQTAVGEQPQTSIEGYCLPSTDIQGDDRVVFDGKVFELDDPISVPEHDTTLYRLNGSYVTDSQ